jgi:alpha-beta hydrolase superfamily lysophospholipase
MKRLLVLLLLALTACSSPSGNLAAQPQQGTLTTSDGLTISYSYLPAKEGAAGMILLHMLGRSKDDYATFARMLNIAGFAVLAIDFRGHGQSAGELHQFSDADFNKMVRDVKAAKQFLARQPGVDSRRIGIVGASIGANIALNYAVDDPDVKTVVLLSPGMNYRGVSPVDSMKRYSNPVMLAAANDDRESAIAVHRLGELAHASGVQVFPGRSHGTQLLETTEADQLARDWLQRELR